MATPTPTAAVVPFSVSAAAAKGSQALTAHEAKKALLRALARALTTHATYQPLYDVYTTISGARELPIVTVEPQMDGVRTQWAKRELMDLTKAAFDMIKEEDARRGLTVPRALVHRAKKFLIPHDGTFPEPRRANRKLFAVRIMRLLERYYGPSAAALFAFFNAAEQQHDMADALLEALEDTQSNYALYAAAVLGRRRPNEWRANTPVLPADAMRGTIRELGLDPGFVWLGTCILELVGMQLPPPGAPAFTDPEPCFCVLQWGVLNLKRAPEDGGPVVYQYAAPGTVLRPLPASELPEDLADGLVAAAKRELAAFLTELAAAKTAKAEKKEAREAANRAKLERQAAKKRAQEEAAAAAAADRPAAQKKRPRKQKEQKEEAEDH